MGYHYRKLVPAVSTTAHEMAEGEGDLAADASEKRGPNDFALWKKSRPGEPAWESKWGPGRPGWHIECSVMATEIQGEFLDIHAGGEDLKFPHHDNEMAQTEAYLGRSQWVNYFWHAGHLHIEGLKMSKSLKNFITIRQVLEMHSARQLRLMFLMQQWDRGMNYSDQAIEMAKAEERKFKHFLGSLKFYLRQPHGQGGSDRDSAVVEATAACEKAFREALLDNFNTPGAVASLSLLVSECLPSFEAMPAASLEPLRTAAAFIEKNLGLLGVEGLTVVPPNEEQWVAAVNAFATLRMEVRVLAKEKAAADKLAEVVAKAEKAAKDVKGNGAKVAVEKLGAFCTAIRAVVKKAGKGTPPAAELMGLCDEVRDKTMVEMGIRLEDGGATGFLWMFEDKEILRKELQ